MKDSSKTKQELIEELSILKKKNKKLEESDAKRKQAEAHREAALEALRKSEERYSMLSQASFEGIIISEKGFVLDANTQAANMLGYDLSEIIGKDGVSLVPPDYRELLRQYILSGNELPYQIPITRKDGTIIHCELRTKASNAGGRIVRVSAFHDITEYKLMEDKLRKREQQLRDTAENIPGVIYQFYAQPDGNIGLHYISESAQKIFGLNSNSEGFFQRFSERVAPECLESFIESITEAMSAVKAWHYEGRFIKESGESIWFIGLSSPVKSEREILFNGVMLDITEQKQAEEALRVSEEQYSKEQKFKQLLLDSSPAFIVAIGFDGKTMMMNQALLDTLEYTKEEITGADYLTTFVPEEDRITLGVVFQKIIQDGNVTVNENRIISSSGKKYLVEWHVRPSIHNGGLGFFLGLGIDITARKRAEDFLRESEVQFSQIFNESPVITVINEIESGRYVAVNRAFIEDVGLPLENIIGKTPQELGIITDEKQIVKVINSINTGEEINGQDLLVHYKGKIKYYNISSRFISIKGVDHILTMLSDVTQRKLAEAAQRDSEQKARAIFDLSFGFMGLLTAEGMVVDINRSALEFAGVQLSDIIGKPFWETPWWTHSPEIQEVLRRAVRDAAGGELVRFEATHPSFDGKLRNIDVTLKAVKDDTGRVIFLIPEGHDITDRKMAEDRLALSEQQMRAILQASPVAIGRIRERKGEWANDMMSRITGYSMQEFQTQDPRVLYENEAEYERVGETLYTEGEVETRWIRKDGAVRDISLQISQTASDAYIFSAMDITERKGAEIELKLSQGYLKSLVESFNEPIWSVDDKLNFLTFNSSFANYVKSVLGLTPEIGKNTRSLYEPEVARFWEDLYTRALGGELFSIEYDYIIEGKKSYFELHLNPIITDNKITGVSVLARNITTRKLMATALYESEERFRSMIHSLSDMIFILDANGQLTYESPSVSRILGYSPGYYIGKSPLEHVHPDDLDKIVNDLDAVIRSANPDLDIPTEFRYRKADGTWADLEVLGSNQGENPGIKGIIITAREITERKKVENKLRESEELFRVSLESAPIGIYMNDLEGNFLFGNYKTEEIIGYSREETNGRNFLDFNMVAEGSLGKALEVLKANIEGKATGPDELEMVRKDGRHILVEVSTTLIHREEQPDNVLAFVRDITELKQAEEEKAKLEAQLRQSQKMEAIGQLAGGIAHDFNNILGAISGYTELTLEHMPANSKADNYLKRVLKATQRAADLVNQILTFSRKKEMELQPLRLSPLIKEVIKFISSTTPTTIEIRQNITAEPDMVMADATYIHQVVMNLCTNANHALQKNGGVMSISLVNENIGNDNLPHLRVNPGHYLKLTVSDTGAGIDPAAIDKIFDPFFTTKKQGEGTGLGLSVVHGIVKSLGGEINVDSHLGQGTSFDIWIPLLKNCLDESIPDNDDTESIRGSGRILFVDDEEDLIEMAKEMLEGLGYEVTAIQNSVNALDMFRANPGQFDLVITDQTMPKMTGMAMAQQIIRIRPDMPVILCSGFSSSVNAEEIRNAGIRHFIVKPMVKNKIATIIHEILKNSRP